MAKDLTALDGSLIYNWKTGMWHWKDGTPEPRVKTTSRAFFAPNFRCVRYGGETFVEIPHDWGNSVDDDDDDTRQVIEYLLAKSAKPSAIFADGLAEQLDDHRLSKHGWLVPIADWDEVMSEPIGVSWDREHQPALLSLADRFRDS